MSSVLLEVKGWLDRHLNAGGNGSISSGGGVSTVSLHHTIGHYSANACLLPLCQLHGAAVTTVEGIGSTKTRIHPVQASAAGTRVYFCIGLKLNFSW